MIKQDKDNLTGDKYSFRTCKSLNEVIISHREADICCDAEDKNESASNEMSAGALIKGLMGGESELIVPYE